MRIRAITLTNVRRFTAPVAIDGIGDGLNVLCEPNEQGKSTLFDAVQALFFLPHGSQARDVKALRPHAGGAPEVSLEVETESGRFVISKRWLSKSTATVTRDGRLIAQADAAEAWIATLLGHGDGGPSGLIWVRQGVTGLDAGSTAERSTALEARRNLLSSVTGEVEAMTGGRRMDLALSRCRVELDTYVTPTGKARVGGPWKAALDRVEALSGRRDALAATVVELRETLDRRKRMRRELAEIEAPEAAARRRARLDTALDRHREAERHAEDLDAEERKIEAARATLASARGRIDALRAALRENTDAERQAAGALAARDAAAPHIVMRYNARPEHILRIDGAALPGDEDLPIPAGTRIVIEGTGTLEIRPGTAAHDSGAVELAEQALRAALDALDLVDMAAARDAAAIRLEAERRHGESSAAYRSLAPDSLAALRDALARIPDATETEDGTDPATAEAALAESAAARDAALARREAAAAQSAARSADLAAADAAETAARERLARAIEHIDRLGAVDEAVLAAAFDRAADALSVAEALRADKAQQAPDLTATRAALDRARSVEDQARADIARLHPALAQIEERIAQRAGEAVEERLVECEEEHTAARGDLARIEHEIAVLQRLQTALQTARTEARERYFAPVAAELAPLLGVLWPDAELTWADDRLLPDTLIRAGHEEPIEILSGGTQEQVALLVRLAFARLVARGGRHAPVILDDALVFSDDDRIERMFDALHRQAGDLQIIVLSCRQRAFRALGGRSLRLRPVSDPAD